MSDYQDNEGLDRSGENPEPGGRAGSGGAAEPPRVDDGPELDGISERDRLIAVALGRGFTYEKAGELAGVSSKTVQRRLADPAFVAAVSRERRRAFEMVSGALTHCTLEAIKTLVAVMRSEGPADQRRAAEAILNLNSRYHRQLFDHDLADRLEKLEAAMATADQPDVHRPATGSGS
jgi:hypothetical protein